MSDIFPGIIQSDPDLIREIRSFKKSLQIIDNRFIFTLPELFECLCQLFERDSGHKIEPQRTNYLRFRKLIYGNPTNSRLKELGGLVEVESANPNHDLIIYKLTIL